MYCFTCGSGEPHRRLNDKEKDWLKKRLGRKSVDEFFICVAPGCRNTRTGLNKKPFDSPIRVPSD
ncbi:hypothetical protein [Streptomyces hoynatensis]|uniref:Uncharacterized protein n=1 Tax=Streptomyces hoynatensis TaxID=1141874 RepID=A0A3A9YXI7_9ACTN|nr:hypothetical protein [Streptomyces hoynatensis]RKN40519.1 hypothetical protein D7294_18005 [Streptomyces hoynatensis]